MARVARTLPHRQPTRREIAARAYQIYLERSCQHGHDLDDWLQAEYELMQLPVRKIAELAPPNVARGKPAQKSLINLVRGAML